MEQADHKNIEEVHWNALDVEFPNDFNASIEPEADTPR